MSKFISLVILIVLLRKFYGSLCVVLGYYDKYFVIFGVLQLSYVIYV